MKTKSTYHHVVRKATDYVDGPLLVNRIVLFPTGTGYTGQRTSKRRYFDVVTTYARPVKANHVIYAMKDKAK